MEEWGEYLLSYVDGVLYYKEEDIMTMVGVVEKEAECTGQLTDTVMFLEGKLNDWENDLPVLACDNSLALEHMQLPNGESSE